MVAMPLTTYRRYFRVGENGEVRVQVEAGERGDPLDGESTGGRRRRAESQGGRGGQRLAEEGSAGLRAGSVHGESLHRDERPEPCRDELEPPRA